MDWTLAVGSINFGIFDIVTIALVLISGIAGVAVGFSRSALKMLSYVVAFICRTFIYIYQELC